MQAAFSTSHHAKAAEREYLANEPLEEVIFDVGKKLKASKEDTKVLLLLLFMLYSFKHH